MFLEESLFFSRKTSKFLASGKLPLLSFSGLHQLNGTHYLASFLYRGARSIFIICKMKGSPF